MKVQAIHEKKEFANIRDMVEQIGSMFEGKVAYRYRVKPHDKEAVKVNYETLRDHAVCFYRSKSTGTICSTAKK